MTYTIKLQPGKIYRITVWIKTDRNEYTGK